MIDCMPGNDDLDWDDIKPYEYRSFEPIVEMPVRTWADSIEDFLCGMRLVTTLAAFVFLTAYAPATFILFYLGWSLNEADSVLPAIAVFWGLSFTTGVTTLAHWLFQYCRRLTWRKEC